MSTFTRAAVALVLSFVLAGIVWLLLEGDPESASTSPELPREEAVSGAQHPRGLEDLHSGARAEEQAIASAAHPPAPALEHLVVAVLDAAGVPEAGMQIAIRVVRDERILFIQRSDKRGEAHFRKAREKLEQEGEEGTLEAVALDVAPEPTRVPLDLERCFQERVELHLPDMALLRVVVIDAEGNTLAKGASVELAEIDESRRSPRTNRVVSRSRKLELDNRSAVFPRVAAHQRLRVLAEDELKNRSALAEHPGLAAGEQGEVVLELRSDVARFCGRALDAELRPLKGTALEVWWRLVRGSKIERELYRVRTGSDGTFAFVPKLGSPGSKHRIEIRAEQGGAAPRAVRPRVEGGLHELGDFELTPWPIALAGRVVDARKHPVAGASVSVIPVGHSQNFDFEIEGSFFLIDPAAAELEPPALLTTDPAGRFVLRRPSVLPLSDELLGAFAVSAECPAGRCFRRLAKRGTTDLELSLRPYGTLAGRILLPSGMDPRRLKLSALTSGVDLRFGHVDIDVDQSGRFEGRVVEGFHSLLVRFGAENGFVALLEQFEVRAGSRAADPRLDLIDLRETHELFNFEINAPAAFDPARAQISFHPCGESNGLTYDSAQITRERVQALLPAGRYDVEFRAPGFQPLDLKGVKAGERVTLRLH